MPTQGLGLFTALDAKMQYLNTRQRVLSQNVANADTPNYQPMDLEEVDFGRVLTKITKENRVRVDATNDKHLPPPNQVENARNRENKMTYEVAPAGNAVILEEQIVEANTNVMDYNLMTSIYQKQVGMFRIAMGTGR